MKALVLFIFALSLFANDKYVDEISYSKIKKLVQKEETIAKAYKQYILVNASRPNVEQLKILLPDGFSFDNHFKTSIILVKNKNQLQNNIPSKIKLKSNTADFYYSNENRQYTRAPINSINNKTAIVLSNKEKYFLKYSSLITKNKSNARNKYYLDNQGILHWYDSSNKYKFSYGENIIIDKSVKVFKDGNVSLEYKNLFMNKEIFYPGQTVFIDSVAGLIEYVDLSGKGELKQINNISRDIGKTILRFSRRGGGMIINGDIYTWGNNENNVISIRNMPFTNRYGKKSNGKPVITTLIKAKAKTYNSNIDSKNYFSSPLRAKFVDFSSDIWHGTCGITLKGEVYCSGEDALNNSGADFEAYNKNSDKNQEILHRSAYFNGKDINALKIFPLINTWLVLANKNTNEKEGYIYYWGANENGFAGNGTITKSKKFLPQKTSHIKFKDIAYSISIGYRRVAGLSTNGDIYTWGLDTYTTGKNTKCIPKAFYTQKGRFVGNYKDLNFCEPMKVQSSVSFTSIRSGQQSFIAKDKDDNFYKISQDMFKEAPVMLNVHKIENLIKSYNYGEDNRYIAQDDSSLLSVDISSKLESDGSLSYGKGIVWVNSRNQLKGDYFTNENKDDLVFKAAINKIKWKQIRVVEDENAICGIDIHNQMYCWGVMSYYVDTNTAGNTFMLPVFMTNLYDLDKDYLLAAGGNADKLQGNLTNMTSGEWQKPKAGKSDQYFIKYPTYFGGFNYEFTFK